MACAINLGSTVLLTGGLTLTTVSQYNEAGWVRDLPQLQEGRTDHGCSSYDNDDGTKVDIDINYTVLLSLYFTISDNVGLWWLGWQFLSILN